MKAIRNTVIAIGAAAGFLTIQQIGFHINLVQDNDMVPLLQKGDIVLSLKGIKHDDLKDRACLVHEPIQKKFLFKRVIAMPNEWVKDNGSKMIISVPQGCLYLETDTESQKKREEDLQSSIDFTIQSQPTGNPYDNVFYSSLVIGTPYYRLYPFDRMGLVKEI